MNNLVTSLLKAFAPQNETIKVDLTDNHARITTNDNVFIINEQPPRDRQRVNNPVHLRHQFTPSSQQEPTSHTHPSQNPVFILQHNFTGLTHEVNENRYSKPSNRQFAESTVKHRQAPCSQQRRCQKLFTPELSRHQDQHTHKNPPVSVKFSVLEKPSAPMKSSVPVTPSEPMKSSVPVTPSEPMKSPVLEKPSFEDFLIQMFNMNLTNQPNKNVDTGNQVKKESASVKGSEQATPSVSIKSSDNCLSELILTQLFGRNLVNQPNNNLDNETQIKKEPVSDTHQIEKKSVPKTVRILENPFEHILAQMFDVNPSIQSKNDLDEENHIRKVTVPDTPQIKKVTLPDSPQIKKESVPDTPQIKKVTVPDTPRIKKESETQEDTSCEDFIIISDATD